MKIGLMGFEFSSPNKGCEALSYSFLAILEKYFGKEEYVEIYNFTSCDLGLIEKDYKNFKFKQVKFKLKDIKMTYIRKLVECDYIFDVTMGDSFSDIYSLEYYNYLMKEKNIASILNRRYVLLPQTYGPFYNELSAKKATKVFKRAYKIYCRDEMSREVLKNDFKIEDALLTSDMAFVLPYDKNMYSFEENSKIKIGINVSGLLYKGGFSSKNQFGLSLDYKKYICDLIEYYLDKNQIYEVHLIPHVIDMNKNANDDDYRVLIDLKEKYSDVIIAPAFNTPIQAKSYISNMNIFIGSRMHSTVAAFSSGVITIPVSYSRKFEGLYNNLNYNYLLNGKEESNEMAFLKTISYVENPDELIKAQNDSMKKVEVMISNFEESLFNMLNECK